MGQCTCLNSRRYVVLDAQADLIVQQELDAGKTAHRDIVTLVLLGTGRSGKSTIFKQCRRAYAQNEFLHDEKMKFREAILSQTITQIQLLVDGCVSLHSQSPQTHPQLQISSENMDLVQELLGIVHVNGMEAPPQMRDLVSRLWRDPAIQIGFRNFRDQFEVYDSSSYFWDEIDRICRDDFVPTDKDCICVRDNGTRVSDVLFDTPSGKTLHVVDLGQRPQSGKKYFTFFTEADIILYVVSLSSFDERVYIDGFAQNSLREALDFFEESLNSEHISDKKFILVFNKVDLFREKLQTTSLSECFDDYKDPISQRDDEKMGDNNNNEKEESALEHVTQQFLDRSRGTGQTIPFHVINATDPGSVRRLFSDIQDCLVTPSPG